MSPRRYDASGRQAQAAAVRRRIVREAMVLYVERGYAGTTVAAVSAAAEVSAPTVYAGFASKVQLLKACIDLALAGDDEDVPVAARPTFRWVMAAGDGRELLDRYATMMGEVAERAGAVYGVLVRAADTDQELAALVANLEGQRLVAARRVADALADSGGLPDGRTSAEAADRIWITGAPEIYLLLTRQRGWTTADYVCWCREALLALAAAPPLTDPAPQPPGQAASPSGS